MLTRQMDLSSPDQYYSDTFYKTPTNSSVFDNLAMSFATPSIAAKDLDSQFSSTPEGQSIHGLYNSIQLEHENNPSWPGWIAEEGASMIGMALNPMTWSLGALGDIGASAIAKGAGAVIPDSAMALARAPLATTLAKPISNYLPETIGKEGAEQPLSLALLGEEGTKAFLTGAGFGVPQGIEENRATDTGNINWGGVARSSAEMGALGIAIGSIPFSLGIIKGKVNRAMNEPINADLTPEKMDQALAGGLITPEEHQWFMDYQAHLQNPEDQAALLDLQKRGSQIISNNGQDVNFATNEAPFKILTEDDMQNLQGAIADQSVADVPDEYKTALSDFMVQNRLDELNAKPETLDGLRGYADFINNKLAQKSDKLAIEDQILDDHMLKGMNDNMPFSQKGIMKFIKQSNFEKSQVDQLPVTIPENIKTHVNLLNKISKLNSKLDKFGENKQTERRISELEQKLPKILTPKEEIQYLREKLLGENGLKNNFQLSSDYQRLVDLAHVWKNARTLLDRVHLEDQYNRQAAFKSIADHIIKVADSNSGKLAKPDEVLSYLKSRVEGNRIENESIPKINQELTEQQKLPSNAEEVLKDQEMQIKDSKAEEAKDQFTDSLNKYNEFKASDGIFKNLISCVMGAMNG